MDQATLITQVADKVGYTKTVVKEVLDGVIGSLQNELVRSGELRINGIGTFKVITRKARTVHCRLGPGGSPLAKPKKITVPEKQGISFKAAKVLRERVQK